MRTKSPLQAEKILRAAEALFASSRFHQVLMEEVAEKAGVGKGTLYRYFHDKEDLFNALLAQASQELFNRVEKARQGNFPLKKKLANIADAIIGLFDERPRLFDLIQHAEAFQAHTGEFPWQATRRGVIDLVMKTFADAATHGECQVAHPDIAALHLLGGVRAIIRLGKKPRPANLGMLVARQFLDGAAQEVKPLKNGKIRKSPK